MWNDLVDPVFDGVGLAVFKSRANACLLALAALSTFVFYYFFFVVFLYIGWYCGAGVFGLLWCRSLSPSLALPTSFNNTNNKTKNIYMRHSN